MFGNLLDKMKMAQEDSKNRLDNIIVSGEADNGNIKIAINGNKVVKDVKISDELINQGDKEAIEELILVAINRAIVNAEDIYNKEMQGVAKDIMPNIPGLNF